MASQVVTADPQAANLPAGMPSNVSPAPATSPAPHPLADDPDFQALQRARQDAGMPDGGAQADGNPDPLGTRAAPQQAPAQPRSGGKGISVPKDRFDQVLQQNRALQEQLSQAQQRQAFLEGNIAATAQQPVMPQQQAPAAQQRPAATVDQQIIAWQQQILQAAQKFDAGEMSMADFVKIQNNATNRISSIREKALHDVTMRQVPRPVQGLADTQILNAETAKLEASSPYFRVFTPADLKFLETTARQEQAGLGRPIGTGPGETLRLRQAIASLANFWGQRWYGPLDANGQRAAQPAPQQQVASAARPQAGKATLAANHPPHVNQASQGQGPGDLSDDRIEQMSTEEIAALPAAVRERIMNR